MRVAAPDGSYHSVVVPSGLSAGQQFSVELLAGHADGTAAEVAKLRVELDAERHLRRDLQQEANRFRSVRHRTYPEPPTLNRASPAHAHVHVHHATYFDPPTLPRPPPVPLDGLRAT